MTLDLKAVEALEKLMAIAAEASRVYNESGCRNGVVPAGDANYEFMGAMANAAPELLALAKEALAARALVEPCAKLIVRLHDQEHPDIDDAADKILAHRDLVSQHQSGGGG